jgi:hypothetical protein
MASFGIIGHQMFVTGNEICHFLVLDPCLKALGPI